MGKCLHATCSFETSPFPIRGRSTLCLKDPSEECDTEIPFLPGWEWRWPPVSCRPRHETAVATVCQGANPQPPAFLQGSVLVFWDHGPQQPLHIEPVGEGPLGSLAQDWLEYMHSLMPPRETALDSIPSQATAPFPCSLSQNRSSGGVGLINEFINSPAILT